MLERKHKMIQKTILDISSFLEITSYILEKRQSEINFFCLICRFFTITRPFSKLDVKDKRVSFCKLANPVASVLTQGKPEALYLMNRWPVLKLTMVL